MKGEKTKATRVKGMFRYLPPKYGENLNIFMVEEQKQVKEKLTVQRGSH